MHYEIVNLMYSCFRQGAIHLKFLLAADYLFILKYVLHYMN